MLGAIIGDIAGSAYEFHNTNDYNCDLSRTGENHMTTLIFRNQVVLLF